MLVKEAFYEDFNDCDSYYTSYIINSCYDKSKKNTEKVNSEIYEITN